MASRLAKLVLAVCLLILCLEIALQIAARFAPSRETAWDPDAEARILCIGDSHTWGAGVERAQSYPAQLQHYLDQHQPGYYSVMNLGIPGMNSSQVRKRFPDWISRYDPDIVVVWVGINNEWNAADRRRTPSKALDLSGIALNSRLYRAIRVLIHDYRLERYRPQTRDERVWSPRPIDRKRSRERDQRIWEVRHDGVIEIITHEASDLETRSRAAVTATEDFVEISRMARSAEIDVIFLTYPLNFGSFYAPNVAALRAAELENRSVILASESVRRVPRLEQEWLHALHPGPSLYREIARDVGARIRRGPLESREVPTAEQFETENLRRERLLFGILKGLATADAELDPKEMDLIESVAHKERTELSIADLEPLPPSAAPEFLAVSVEPDPDRWSLAKDMLVARLEQLASADGTRREAEAAFTTAVIREIDRNRPDAEVEKSFDPPRPAGRDPEPTE